MENTKKENVLKRFASAVGGNNLVLIGAIIVVFILFTAINPNYLTWTNFVNLLVAASLVGIVAGNDLLCCTDFETQIPAVTAAVEKGEISEERIDESVQRILEMKISLGLIEPEK